MKIAQSNRVWTVVEAKSKLSEILRLAETEGPQCIGVRKSFVVVPADVWQARVAPRKPLGQWLIENVPRGLTIEIPCRDEEDREIPFFSNSKCQGF